MKIITNIKTSDDTVICGKCKSTIKHKSFYIIVDGDVRCISCVEKIIDAFENILKKSKIYYEKEATRKKSKYELMEM